MTVIYLLVLVYFAYSMLLYGIALSGRQSKIKGEYKPVDKILVLIPAHDEERVIGNLLNDLKGQDCGVTVVCDHCQDKTKEIAASHQAKIYQRESGLPGKQHALQEYFSQINYNWDGVIILDADNRVEKDFIEKMKVQLKQHPVVQAYLDVVESNNIISRGYEINYRLMNGVMQRARQLLGFTPFLGGTGWGIRKEVIRNVQFDCDPLVDDMEYTIKLWLYGYKVVYVEDVKIYDEKPKGLKQSYIQRLRWTRGGFQVLKKYFRAIMFQVIIFKRFSGVELLLFLLQYFLAAMNFVFLSINIILAKINLTFWLSFQLIYFGLYILTDYNSRFKLMFWLPSVIFVNLTGLPLGLHGLLTWKKQSWVRTEHFGIK